MVASHAAEGIAGVAGASDRLEVGKLWALEGSGVTRTPATAPARRVPAAAAGSGR